MTPKVGIFAGSFDPVHNGHVAVALAAQSQCGLDKVFFMVEPRPRRKQGVKALDHRIAMVERAIAEHDGLGSIIVEQDRFTIHKTLPPLQARFVSAKLYMIIGDDVLAHLSHWPKIDQLPKLVRLLIVPRKQSKQATHDYLKELEQTRGLKFESEVLDDLKLKISSSSVRQSLRRGDRPQDIPPQVLEYIIENKLYASSETGS